jgi:hypothetical protein
MKPIPFANPCERIIGLTIPTDGHFHLCDYDEVWEVAIGPPLTIEPSDLRPYRLADTSDDFIGWGQTRNAPILSSGTDVISYAFDPHASHVELRYRVGGVEGRIDFPTFSGDWFCASFSRDGRHLVLAEPYRVDLYEVA